MSPLSCDVSSTIVRTSSAGSLCARGRAGGPRARARVGASQALPAQLPPPRGPHAHAPPDSPPGEGIAPARRDSWRAFAPSVHRRRRRRRRQTAVFLLPPRPPRQQTTSLPFSAPPLPRPTVLGRVGPAHPGLRPAPPSRNRASTGTGADGKEGVGMTRVTDGDRQWAPGRAPVQRRSGRARRGTSHT